MGMTKYCEHCKRGSGVVSDRLSQLSDDILLSIMSSSLTIEEVARTSVLSKRWKHLWRHIPVLNFEDSEAMKMMARVDGGNRDNEPPFEEEKSAFVTHVNNVLIEEHDQGTTINELRIVFDLDVNYASHIDKWVTCALQKHVERFELNLEPAGEWWKSYEWVDEIWIFPIRKHYTLEVVGGVMNLDSLTSLRLMNVDVSSETVQVFFKSCPLLASLYVARSDILTRVTAPPGHSLVLERLEIVFCPNIETVDICAPCLLSLKYDGIPINLNITNASLLFEVHIGGHGPVDISPAYDSLSEGGYLSKLKYLSLRMPLEQQLNSKPSHIPALTSLKHLKLHVYCLSDQTLLGWTSWIHACPVLEKLTLEFKMLGGYTEGLHVISEGEPLPSLKTLEIIGFYGMNVDVEIAAYVLKIGRNVNQVIIDFRSLPREPSITYVVRRFKILRNEMLRMNIGQGRIKFSLKKTYPNPAAARRVDRMSRQGGGIVAHKLKHSKLTRKQNLKHSKWSRKWLQIY